MTHSLPLFLLLAAACSGPAYLPDGGRPRQTCRDVPTALSVKAQDIMGQPISGAEVTAKNTTNGKIQTGTTGSDGRTSQLNDDLGNGQIEITAVAGALSTKQPFIVQLLCGECDCTAMPANTTLTLEQ